MRPQNFPVKARVFYFHAAFRNFEKFFGDVAPARKLGKFNDKFIVFVFSRNQFFHHGTGTMDEKHIVFRHAAMK